MTNQQATLMPSQGDRSPSDRHNGNAQPGKNQHRNTTVALIIAVLLGLTLSGCDLGDTLWDLFSTDGDAEAQTFANDAQRVKTFVITTDTFIIETSNDDDPTPTAVVQNNAMEYTMQSNGIVRFDESNGDNKNLEVETGDRIIERPGASGTGTLTIIVASPSNAQPQ